MLFSWRNAKTRQKFLRFFKTPRHQDTKTLSRCLSLLKAKLGASTSSATSQPIANSQKPKANSQQPIANSQQP